jgi:hypothetical protein
MGYNLGYQEDTFLKQMELDVHEFDFLADNCTKVSKSKGAKQYNKFKSNLTQFLFSLKPTVRLFRSTVYTRI